MRFIFFALGVPMMIMSFFQAIDAMPFVQETQLYVGGQEIVLSEDQAAQLKEQVEELLQDSHTMPSLSVVFGDDFQDMFQERTFISLKFNSVYEINDLPFDELLFEVTPDSYGFNLFRGNSGIVQGRCVYIDLNGKTTNSFYQHVQGLLTQNQEVVEKPEILPPETEKPGI